MYKFYHQRLVHASYLGSFTFLCASTLSIAKNVFIRFYDGEHIFAPVAARMVPWLLTIGSFIFVYSAFYSAVQQLRNDEGRASFLTKAKLITANQVSHNKVSRVHISIQCCSNSWSGNKYILGFGVPRLYSRVVAGRRSVLFHRWISRSK